MRVGAQSKMWPLLGWFSGLMCVGSVAGMVAWCAASQSNSNYYQAFTSSTRQQYYLVIGACDRWLAVFGVPYGLEFLCLVMCTCCVACDMCVVWHVTCFCKQVRFGAAPAG